MPPETRPSCPGAATATHALLAGIIAITVIGLVLLGALEHPFPVPGGEYDRYADMARKMAAGHLGFDRFHPFLYPLLVYLCEPLFGDAFVAGRVVSAFSAGGLLLAIWWLASELLPGRRALFVVLAAAVSPHLLLNGVQVTSDMLAAALLTTALAAAIRLQRTGSARLALVLGLATGAALATRFASSVVVPIVAWTVLSRPRRGLLGGLALLGIAIGYLPHAVLAVVAGVSPLANDAWETLVLKVECDMNFGRFYELSKQGLPTPSQWLMEWWPETLRLMFADLGAWVSVGAQRLWLGLPPLRWPGIAFAVLMGLAFVRLWRLDRRARMLCAFAVLQVVVVSAMLLPEPRQTLSIMPLGILACVAAGHAAEGAMRRGTDAVAITLLVLSAIGGVREVARFVAGHPTAEIALARELPGRLQRVPVLISSYTLMDNAVAYPVLTMALLGRSDRPPPGELFARIEESMRKNGADAVMIGRVTRRILFEALRDAEPPPSLSVLHRDDDVLLFQRNVPPTDWISSASAELRDGRIHCHIELAPQTDPRRLIGVGLTVLDPDNGTYLLTMIGDAERGYAIDFAATVGDWHLTPGLILDDHTILRGNTHVVRVP